MLRNEINGQSASSAGEAARRLAAAMQLNGGVTTTTSWLDIYLFGNATALYSYFEESNAAVAWPCRRSLLRPISLRLVSMKKYHGQ